MKNFPNLKNPIHFIATLGGIGTIPLAPGTFGSAFALFLFIYLSHYTNMLIISLVVIVFSIWICSQASKYLKDRDHKSIVIDELSGMWLSLLPALFLTSQETRTFYALVVFIFFRLFDVWKPFPISYIDKNYKNGFGIVLDDLLAGVLAIFPAYLLTLFLFL